MTVSVVAALVAAFCFALSTTLHQRAAKRQQQRRALDPRLLLRLLRTRLWQLGWAPDVAGVAAQTLALRHGPLTLVQPLLASGLFMAILIEAVWNRQPVHRRDLAATLVGTAGLVTFLAAADPRAGVTDPSTRAWWWVAAVAGTAVVACLLVARPVGDATRGALLGVATGILYGVSAALLKSVTTRFTGDLAALALDPRLWALLVVALLGVQLNQNAFQHGRIAAPLVALTLTEPVTGVLVGATAFRETLTLTGIRLPLVVVSVVALVVGVWLGAARAGTGRAAGRPPAVRAGRGRVPRRSPRR
ncbi:DMT family transporter [Micromonospora sp. NPDC092111]|uniref:DMT family transporter n=1 Tax=Micromonospora sp. NPDC092111 TaxID=3364289 RepID=UPI0038154F95